MYSTLRNCVLEIARLNQDGSIQLENKKIIALEEFDDADEGDRNPDDPRPAIMDPALLTYTTLKHLLRMELGFNETLQSVMYVRTAQYGETIRSEEERVIDSDISLRGGIKVLQDAGRFILKLYIREKPQVAGI
jgi:hypothetical protein